MKDSNNKLHFKILSEGITNFPSTIRMYDHTEESDEKFMEKTIHTSV